MSKYLTIEEIDALILDAEEERDEAKALGAQWWASTADHIIKTLCRFQANPHIESEPAMNDYDYDARPIWAGSQSVARCEEWERQGWPTPVSGDDTAVLLSGIEATC